MFIVSVILFFFVFVFNKCVWVVIGSYCNPFITILNVKKTTEYGALLSVVIIKYQGRSPGVALTCRSNNTIYTIDLVF